jgi:radical SAM superfamily enzyme YgiQ (UPF0313 family)
MMRLLLIQPSRIEENGVILKWKRPFHPNLTISYLAALTPDGIDVDVVDERVEEISFNGDYDLIGITALTSQAPRAYQIADMFRNRGKRVVMGGIHASVVPDEAMEHCDAVVSGEAENVWADVLEDFKAGNPKKFYRSEKFHDLKKLPKPRFDLLNRKDFSSIFMPIQASRGCPHNCDFCSVTKFFGKSYRFRPVEDVVREVKASGAKRFTLVDDNITANRRYSKELFNALKPLKIRWIGQSTINLGRDPELCKLAAESGCYFMGIGIESVDQDNLNDMDKPWNRVGEFPKLLDTIRKNRIGLVLNMIVGLDHDDERVFEKTVKFLMKSHTFHVILNTPIPYPGTKFALRLEREGRLLHKDWSQYTQGNIVFSPKLMSPECVKAGYWNILDRFFSYPSVTKRAFYQSWKNLYYFFRQNIEFRMSVKKRVY